MGVIRAVETWTPLRPQSLPCVGPGVRWCADGTKAWRLQDGIAGDEIELEEAATIAAEIGRPVPDFPRPVLSTSKFG